MSISFGERAASYVIISLLNDFLESCWKCSRAAGYAETPQAHDKKAMNPRCPNWDSGVRAMHVIYFPRIFQS